MKMKSKYLSTILAAALFTGMSVLTAFAGSTGSYVPLVTVEQAKTLPEKANVMMACSGCQTIMPVNKKGIMAWFDTKTTHDCPSCSGKMSFTGVTGKSGSGVQYTHTCSMCGNASAYVCATH